MQKILSIILILLAADCSGMAYLRSAAGAFSSARTAAWQNLSKFGRFGWQKPLFKTAARQSRPAETFFFKTNGESITEDEHTILYDIKLRNQFPMCLAYGDGATVPDDEIAAIQQELDEKLPGVRVMFIPTCMYERIVISGVDQMPFMGKHKHDDFNVSYNRLNHRRRAHYEANALIASYLVKCQTGNMNSIFRAIERLVNSNNTSSLERDVMQREKEAYDRGEFLLLRAVRELEEEPLGNQSLSFGASLYGSMINDQGASPYFYMHNGFRAYCVPINKKDFAANKNNLPNMFYIPPLTTVENIFAHSQVFHPRTKVIQHVLFSAGKRDGLLRFSHQSHIRRFMKTDLIIKAQTPEKAEQIHRDIFEYIKKNRILLKSY